MTNTNSLTQLYTSGGNTGFSVGVSWNAFSGSYSDQFSAETAYDFRDPTATSITLLKMGFRVTANTTSAITFVSRKNGTTTGNQTVSTTASTIGWYQDTTHTDSVTSADTWYSQRGGGNGLTTTMQAITTQNTSPLALYGARRQSSAVSLTTTVAYAPFLGTLNSFGTESFAQEVLRAAGTLKNLSINLSSVPSAGNTGTVKFRKGGVDGNQVVTATSSSTTTSVIQDTTHTDSIASGDNCNASLVGTASSGAVRWFTFEFAGTTSIQDIGSVTSTTLNLGTGLSASTNYFFAWGGELTAQTSEVGTQYHCSYALTATRLRMQVLTNTTNGWTAKARKNSADGNLLISVANGTTGDIEDATHSDSFVSGDDGNLGASTGSSVTTLHLATARLLLDDGSNTGGGTAYSDSVTETASAADTPSAVQGRSDSVSEAASAAETETAALVQTSAVTESGSATDSPTAGLTRAASASEATTAAATQDAILVSFATKNVTLCFMG